MASLHKYHSLLRHLQMGWSFLRPEMNEFLRTALAPEFRTEEASDGTEGLALAHPLRPDLVLTDVVMPGLSGEDLLTAIRSHPELAFVPVVFLTARADEALRARLLAEGAQDYVTKPVSIPELRARVGNLAAMKRARDVLQAEIAEQAEDVGRLAEEVARRKRELQTALDSMPFAREQAERASAQKTNLMHLVSHELRTPISALVLPARATASRRGPDRGAPPPGAGPHAGIDRAPGGPGRVPAPGIIGRKTSEMPSSMML